jgi:hypothetical protein
MLRRLILLVTVSAAIQGLTACPSPARPQQAPTTPIGGPTVPTLSPTPLAEGGEPATTFTPEQELVASTDWSQVAGQEGDLYLLGNPDAPIRIIDYSDFL